MACLMALAGILRRLHPKSQSLCQRLSLQSRCLSRLKIFQRYLWRMRLFTMTTQTLSKSQTMWRRLQWWRMAKKLHQLEMLLALLSAMWTERARTGQWVLRMPLWCGVTPTRMSSPPSCLIVWAIACSHASQLTRRMMRAQRMFPCSWRMKCADRRMRQPSIARCSSSFIPRCSSRVWPKQGSPGPCMAAHLEVFRWRELLRMWLARLLSPTTMAAASLADFALRVHSRSARSLWLDRSQPVSSISTSGRCGFEER
mmetsp:Transcript_28421/g.65936  ORF Transcript_28421/g.65936 Transcript_28421/m.65936 type:complete len:256 (-) Transcript_28421:1092-1859(-)